MRLFDARHITDPAGNNKALSETHCGMAHFAQPDAGKTCRECIWWQPVPKEPGVPVRHYRNSVSRVLLDRPCQQYTRLMRNQRGARIPHDALACRYFAETALPPPYRH